MAYLQRAVRLDPTASSLWKLLGNALIQDGKLVTGCAAFRAAVNLAPMADMEARAGLATVLTQLGQASEAAEELLQVRSIDPRSRVAALTSEPLERLCRRLMPAHRFASVQPSGRAEAWMSAIVALAKQKRILDVSSTALPAMLAATAGGAHRPVLRADNTPRSVVESLLEENQLDDDKKPGIELLPVGQNGLPAHVPSAPLLVGGSTPNMLIVDSDAIDIMASSFLPTICAARQMVAPEAEVMPSALEVHVAVIESHELTELNQVTDASTSFNLTAVNSLSHRTRLVRLSQLKHKMLTRSKPLLFLSLDDADLPSIDGDEVVELDVERTGTPHAIVVWHTFWLSCNADGEYEHPVSTGPDEASEAVRQVAHFLWPAKPGEANWVQEGERRKSASSQAKLDAWGASEAVEEAEAKLQEVTPAADAAIQKGLEAEAALANAREKASVLAKRAEIAQKGNQKQAAEAAKASEDAESERLTAEAMAPIAIEAGNAVKQAAKAMVDAMAVAVASAKAADAAAQEAWTLASVEADGSYTAAEVAATTTAAHAAEVTAATDQVHSTAKALVATIQAGHAAEAATEVGVKEPPTESVPSDAVAAGTSGDGPASDDGLGPVVYNGETIGTWLREAVAEPEPVVESESVAPATAPEPAKPPGSEFFSANGSARVYAGGHCRILVRRQARRIEFQLCAVHEPPPTRLPPQPSDGLADKENGQKAEGDNAPVKRSSVLLARSATDAQRVSDQNFATGRSGAPLAEYHFPMLNDKPRNNAFGGALTKAVQKLQPNLVLDIGAGTGLLAMYAARAGAPRVLAAEMAPEMARLATEMIATNGLTHAVRVVAAHSSRLRLEDAPHADPWERKADLLVFEILGTDPLCEGLLPALRDARSRLLHPDAVVIPCGIEVHAVLVSCEALMRLNSANVPTCGLNLSPLSAMSHRTRAVRLLEYPHVKLTRAKVTLKLRLDTTEPPPSSGETEVELTCEHTNTGHMVVAWFTCHLDNEISISTAPGVADPMRGYSWGQSAHFLPQPVNVEAGEVLRLRTRWTDMGLSFGIVRQREDYRGPKVVAAADTARKMMAHMTGHEGERYKARQKLHAEEEERKRIERERRAAIQREREAAKEAEREKLHFHKQQLAQLTNFEDQIRYMEENQMERPAPAKSSKVVTPAMTPTKVELPPVAAPAPASRPPSAPKVAPAPPSRPPSAPKPSPPPEPKPTPPLSKPVGPYRPMRDTSRKFHGGGSSTSSKQ